MSDTSYEREIENLREKKESLPEKLDISTIKYFWQANSLFGSGKDSVPRFLRNMNVFKNFTDNELRILSGHLHLRHFASREVIFRQKDIGTGFYLIFKGHVEIAVENADGKDEHIVTLEEFDSFGELALLQENSPRNATIIAKESCQLLGVFKPDLDNLIEEKPVVAAKLLQSVSLIIANRLFSLTKEVGQLKNELKKAKRSES